MRNRNLALLIGAGTLLLSLLSFAPAPALAQADNASPCAPGQPNDRPPGQPPNRPGQPSNRPPEYPPGECQVQISQSVAAQGTSFSVSGSGFQPGCPVDVILKPDGTVLDTIIADTSGIAAGVVTVPIDATVGPGQVEAVQSGNCPARVLGAVFEVTPSGGAGAPVAGPGAADSGRASRGGTARAGAGLPLTGIETGALTASGAALIALGTAAVIAARRRRSATTAA